LFHGIPWGAFSEEEIQALLKLHFEREGYNVQWIHKDDRAHEKGTDIVCTSLKDGRRIGIAVKNKPRKRDILQLYELVEAPVDDRIYIYVDGMARSFHKAIEKNKAKIQVWNRKELERRLIFSGLMLKLLIDNSRSIRILTKLVRQIESVVKNERESLSDTVFLGKLSENIPRLWGLKDRVVTLHKSSKVANMVFERQLTKKIFSDEEMIKFCLSWLNFLEIECLEQLDSEFRVLMGNDWILLRLAYKENPLGSNWLHLHPLPFVMQPGKIVQSSLILQNTHMNQIVRDTIRHIILVGWSLEGTIDQMFKIVMGHAKAAASSSA